MMYKFQFRKIDPHDWFCGPGSQILDNKHNSAVTHKTSSKQNYNKERLKHRGLLRKKSSESAEECWDGKSTCSEIRVVTQWLPSKYCGPGAVGEQGDGPPLSGLTCEHNPGVRTANTYWHTTHTISVLHTVYCAQIGNNSIHKEYLDDLLLFTKMCSSQPILYPTEQCAHLDLFTVW